ncbi:interleukin-17F-like [Hyperolius riggenbachi]|uniref:interleukin-17F-like n=1 Tax=Hyperolius riggenbachi TaxID=752182 RepID=UPI0035A2794A
METTGSTLICMAVLVSVCSSAFLPEEYMAQMGLQEEPSDDTVPPEPRQRCVGRRSRRPPASANVDISVINTDYMESLLEAMEVNSRSLSPWEYRLNTDPERFPSVISEADCFTFSCEDSEGNADPSLMSHPIQQEVMVLRKHYRDCDYSFTLETELVTVGCTCVSALRAYHY